MAKKPTDYGNDEENPNRSFRYGNMNEAYMKELEELMKAFDIPALKPEPYRKPRLPSIFDPAKPNESVTPPKPPSDDPRDILKPLDEVFFDPQRMDDLIVHTSVPQLLERQLPLFPGVILFGPPGTGKSEFQRALCRVYENAGAYAKQVPSSELNTKWVGEFARNVRRELECAQEQGKIRGLPSLLCFDEGSILVENAKSGASSVSKHYQEAIDEFKRYIGNDIGDRLVLAISTNQLPEEFEEAMTREGRLETFLISPPAPEQIARMWYHFLAREGVMELSEEQARGLVQIAPHANGAMIAKFAKAYVPLRRRMLLAESGYATLLEALKDRYKLSEEELRKTITYENLAQDLAKVVTRKRERNGHTPGNGGVPPMGFHTLTDPNDEV